MVNGRQGRHSSVRSPGRHFTSLSVTLGGEPNLLCSLRGERYIYNLTINIYYCFVLGDIEAMEGGSFFVDSKVLLAFSFSVGQTPLEILSLICWVIMY